PESLRKEGFEIKDGYGIKQVVQPHDSSEDSTNPGGPRYSPVPRMQRFSAPPGDGSSGRNPGMGDNFDAISAAPPEVLEFRSADVGESFDPGPATGAAWDPDPAYAYKAWRETPKSYFWAAAAVALGHWLHVPHADQLWWLYPGLYYLRHLRKNP